MTSTPLVKICGVRRREDALLAAELGASAIGFVFWPDSPRFIDPFRARAIVAALPPFVTPVGVFVDQPDEYIGGVAGLVRLGAVQLHGNEPAASYTRAPYRVIKSVPVGSPFDPETVREVPAHVTVLLDAHDPVRRGGTGRAIDWTSAAGVARTRRTVLAGGLTAGNVRDAIDQVSPYALDISSGVESAPGVKDAGKLRELFRAIHG
jgi:phosphoribosylanthranilate isomerase